MVPALPKEAVGAVPGGSIDIEKKIRNITKKLEQIQDLKTKLSSGVPLELTQLSKIDSQPKWEAEVINFNKLSALQQQLAK